MIHPKTISIGPKTDIAISLPYNNRDDKKILSADPQKREGTTCISLFLLKKIKKPFF